MQRRAAFTLIEMVTVIAVVGVLASMAIPRFGRTMELRRADAAARLISADVLRAREYARVSGVPRTIVYDATKAAYTIDLPDPDRPRSTIARDLNALYGAALSGVDFKSGAQLSFTAEGAPSTGGTLTVAVGRIARTITVNAVTGTATIAGPVQIEAAVKGGAEVVK